MIIGFLVKLSFGTFNSVKLIFGRIGMREAVKLIQENDRESSDGFLDWQKKLFLDSELDDFNVIYQF